MNCGIPSQCEVGGVVVSFEIHIDSFWQLEINFQMQIPSSHEVKAWRVGAKEISSQNMTLAACLFPTSIENTNCSPFFYN